jgi:hypothetical protein
MLLREFLREQAKSEKRAFRQLYSSVLPDAPIMLSNPDRPHMLPRRSLINPGRLRSLAFVEPEGIEPSSKHAPTSCQRTDWTKVVVHYLESF